MKEMERRDFLKMAAAGSAALAVTAMPLGIFQWLGPNRLKFRAVLGMPQAPVASYASFVVEGNIDLTQRSGIIRKSLYLGAPGSISTLLFPGSQRIFQVTDVVERGDVVHLTGALKAGSTLGPRESQDVVITVDRSQKTARADFLGREVFLQVQ